MPWEDFVKLAVDLTLQAYDQMRAANVAKPSWLEDQFTACLAEDYLRPLCFDHPLQLTVVARARLHTASMRAGNASTKAAGEIDIRMIGRWEREYHEIFFAWEAKRVADPASEPNLVGEYVTNGLLRFIDCDYAERVNDAGMLAYVVSSTSAKLMEAINKSMTDPHRKRKLATTDHLQAVAQVGKFATRFTSTHSRLPRVSTPIRLAHLFLEFFQ